MRKENYRYTGKNMFSYNRYFPPCSPFLLTTSDSPEALLARCVPNLELHPLVFKEQLFYFEVDSYGCYEAAREGILRES